MTPSKDAALKRKRFNEDVGADGGEVDLLVLEASGGADALEVLDLCWALSGVTENWDGEMRMSCLNVASTDTENQDGERRGPRCPEWGEEEEVVLH